MFLFECVYLELTHFVETADMWNFRLVKFHTSTFWTYFFISPAKFVFSYFSVHFIQTRFCINLAFFRRIIVYIVFKRICSGISRCWTFWIWGKRQYRYCENLHIFCYLLLAYSIFSDLKRGVMYRMFTKFLTQVKINLKLWESTTCQC